MLVPVLRGRMAVLDKSRAGRKVSCRLCQPSAWVNRGTGAAGLQGPAYEGEKQALNISATGYDQRNLKGRLR